MVVLFAYTLFCMPSLISPQESFILKNIFNDTDGILAGFGDFNADKRVDVFKITNQGHNVDVLLANANGQYTKQTIIQTFDSKSFISGIVLTDFNGDGFLDVACFNKSSESNWLDVYWGSADGLDHHKQLDLQVSDEPVLFEYNGDGLPDLLVGDSTGTKYIFLSRLNKTFENVTFSSQGSLLIPHSSAFVNITPSKNIDLILTMEQGNFHVFSDYDYSNFTSYQIEYKDKNIGQSSFGDLNQDALIDHIIPIGNRINVYSKKAWHTLFELPSEIEFDYGNVISVKQDVTYNIPVTLIIGDYDSDSYQDILTIVKKGGQHVPLLLRNIPCGSDIGCAPYGRSFEIKPLPQVEGDIHMATFYDYMEDGSLDILLLSVTKNSSITQTQLVLLKNIVADDTCFLKVTVSNGWLDKFPLADNKPYGVNMPGPSVFYETINTKGGTRKSSATQLSQSAHFSLQLPFVLFGLGQTPNFIDTIIVAFPHEHKDADKLKKWTQIVPNSQLIVNPHPLHNPSLWTMQLFVMPSKQIYTTAAVLGSTCVGLVFIVAGLLWKEAKEDKVEKKQESHRFNFDAM